MFMFERKIPTPVCDGAGGNGTLRDVRDRAVKYALSTFSGRGFRRRRVRYVRRHSFSALYTNSGAALETVRAYDVFNKFLSRTFVERV